MMYNDFLVMNLLCIWLQVVESLLISKLSGSQLVSPSLSHYVFPNAWLNGLIIESLERILSSSWGAITRTIRRWKCGHFRSVTFCLLQVFYFEN